MELVRKAIGGEIATSPPETTGDPCKNCFMVRISDITALLEAIAPPALQEGYDNSGLLVGEPSTEVKGVLVSLDVTEDVVAEAVERGCNLIVSHHPIVFRPLKRLTGKNQVERTIMMALRSGVGLYAIHTNLDNVAHGVNAMMCRKLGLGEMRVLRPKGETLSKVVTYVPHAELEEVRNAMFAAGAGEVGGYDACSFSSEGTGTFRAQEGADPHVGDIGTRHEEPETRLEVVVERWNVGRVLAAMWAAHPYEEVAHDVIQLDNIHPTAGSGGIGVFDEPMAWGDFVQKVKLAFDAPIIRHTAPPKEKIKTVALCGGTGSFLLPDAIRAGAQVFLSSDFKYHEFFDAEGRVTIADIGHAEAESGISEWLVNQMAVLKDGFPNFAVLLSAVRTNPIQVS
jgi:dinuclear metal center YbgI/SA1388 family protein